MSGRDINTFTVSGNITRQPEITRLPSGTDVLKLRLAVNGRRKHGDTWVDKPNYFDVEVWGGSAGLLKKVISDGTDLKGHRLIVCGELDYQEWQDRDTQQTRSRIVLKVAPGTGDISYEGPPRNRRDNTTTAPATPAAPPAHAAGPGTAVPVAPLPGEAVTAPAPVAAQPVATASAHDLPF